MKRVILFSVFFIFVSLVFADLDRNVYAPGENFDGIISFDEEVVALDEKIYGDVDDCGSYSEKSIDLYDILGDSYSGKKYTYDKVGNAFSSITLDFPVGQEIMYGFFVDSDTVPASYLYNFSFSMSGDAGPIKMDIGLDGYDWRYFGEPNAIGTTIHAEGYDIGHNYNSANSVNPNYDKCSWFSIPIQELQTGLKVEVKAIAKIVDALEEGDELRAYVGNDLGSCVLSEIDNMDLWTEVSCEINLNFDLQESPLREKVCIYSNSAKFRIPQAAGIDYYFVELNPYVYSINGLNINDLAVPSLKTQINSYINENCEGWCVVPFSLYNENAGSFQMTSLLTFSNGDEISSFYSVDTSALNTNVSEIDLGNFNELVVPDKINDSCELKIEFLGEDYAFDFSVAEGPDAVIKTSSDYAVKEVNIGFDGSSSVDAVSYSWDFGDNNSAEGVSAEHKYLEEGEYVVSLSVKDSNGVGNVANKIIQVKDVISVLENEIPEKIDLINSSLNRFNDFNGSIGEFVGFMNFNSVLENSFSEMNSIESNFDNLSGANESEYIDLYNEMISVVSSIPIGASVVVEEKYLDYKPLNKNDVPSFSKVSGYTNLEGFKNNVYLYNQGNILGDYYYNLIKVNYLGKSENYVYVSKEFDGSGDLVENIGLYKNINVFSSGCNLENGTNAIFCSGASSLKYASLDDEIRLTSGFIISSDLYSDEEEEIIYQFDCSDSEYKCCGDGACQSGSFFEAFGVNEKDSENSNYCPQDCGRTFPWIWFSVLAFVLILGVFWINFYKGPGNFFDITNAISFKIAHRKVFLTEKDKIALKTYILKAMREGFSEGDIKKALLRKGWSKKQLNLVFHDLKK